MHRTATFLAFCTAVASAAAQADDAVDGIPAGVLIMDAPAPEAVTIVDAAPTVELPATVEIAPLVISQSPASTRSASVPLTVEASPNGAVILDPATVAPQIDLAPGETVLQVIAVPSIVKIPEPQPVYTISARPAVPVQRAPPPPKVDPVSGRLRDTAGWTGRYETPASIGCFPEGACAVLNQR